MTKSRYVIYLVFTYFLAIWIGSAVFDTLSSNLAWFKSPVEYVRGFSVPAGTVNPWPITTACLALATILAGGSFARYRGPGYREVLTALIGTALILLLTGFYFVPALMRLFYEKAKLPNDEIISMSRTWVVLNVLRNIALGVLFFVAQIGLSKMSVERKLRHTFE